MTVRVTAPCGATRGEPPGSFGALKFGQLIVKPCRDIADFAADGFRPQSQPVDDLLSQMTRVIRSSRASTTARSADSGIMIGSAVLLDDLPDALDEVAHHLTRRSRLTIASRSHIFVHPFRTSVCVNSFSRALRPCLSTAQLSRRIPPAPGRQPSAGRRGDFHAVKSMMAAPLRLVDGAVNNDHVPPQCRRNNAAAP
jgi:hypothetical protein